MPPICSPASCNRRADYSPARAASRQIISYERGTNFSGILEFAVRRWIRLERQQCCRCWPNRPSVCRLQLTGLRRELLRAAQVAAVGQFEGQLVGCSFENLFCFFFGCSFLRPKKLQLEFNYCP